MCRVAGHITQGTTGAPARIDHTAGAVRLVIVAPDEHRANGGAHALADVGVLRIEAGHCHRWRLSLVS